jgi:hypothetical protein
MAISIARVVRYSNLESMTLPILLSFAVGLPEGSAQALQSTTVFFSYETGFTQPA